MGWKNDFELIPLTPTGAAGIFQQPKAANYGNEAAASEKCKFGGNSPLISTILFSFSLQPCCLSLMVLNFLYTCARAASNLSGCCFHKGFCLA
jgi:hypothetical protein